MLTVRIRPIQSSDRSSWEDLCHQYLSFYDSEAVSSHTELLWARLVNVVPEINGVVATEDSKVLGFAHFHFQISSWSSTSHCYLEDLFVDPECRGQGAGAALIEAVKLEALKAEASEMFWITRAGNQKARSLYDRLAGATDFVRYEILLKSRPSN